MSYEQKYLKYKQKYQELKKLLAGINNLEVDASTDVQEFVLTETPTFENQQQTGGSINEETEMISLSDTPNDIEENVLENNSLIGGNNTQSDVIENNIVGGNDEMTSTTEIDKIQNTEDIERLFNQLGGKKKRHSRKSRRTSDLENLENIDSSDESSVTTTESLTDISSDDSL